MIFGFLTVLRFELRALSLLSGCSTTGATTPARVFNFNEGQSVFLIACAFGVTLKNHCQTQSNVFSKSPLDLENLKVLAFMLRSLQVAIILPAQFVQSLSFSP
jgi:hypothetical protein